MIVSLRAEAEADIADAARWYGQQRLGLGDEFLDEVLRTAAFIAESPRGYPLVHGAIRRAVTRRFPFGVFYSVDDEGVVVLSVMHASRHPAQWKNRP